jgi:hypothetical protein
MQGLFTAAYCAVLPGPAYCLQGTYSTRPSPKVYRTGNSGADLLAVNSVPLPRSGGHAAAM